jgi:hypothetical protein
MNTGRVLELAVAIKMCLVVGEVDRAIEFVNELLGECEEAAQYSVQSDGAESSAEVDPIVKAVNGMLDACVQPPRRDHEREGRRNG